MVRASSLLVVASLSKAVSAAEATGTESAGMLQLQSRGTARAAAGAGMASAQRLFDTAQRLLREGATPAVADFTAEMLEKLQDEVLPNIKLGHSSDMGLMDSAFTALNTVITEHEARMQSVKAKRATEQAASQEHQECRLEDEKPTCDAWQACEEELAILTAQYDKEEKDFRELVRMNECEVETHEAQHESLLQAKHHVHAEQKREHSHAKAEARKQAPDAQGAAACPWLEGASEEQDHMTCMDGTSCNVEADGWECCDHRGGRGKCPPAFPHLCGDGSCQLECTESVGGPKICTEGTACRDVAEWIDSDGDGCAAYHSCAGGQPLWNVQTYEPYKNLGHTAVTACCKCGGGTSSNTEREELIRVPQCNGEAAQINAIVDAQRLVYKSVVKEGQERFQSWFAKRDKEAECKSKETALALQRAKCDEDKIKLELASCASAAVYEAAVHTFETNWKTELEDFRQVCTTVTQNAKDRKAELQALTEVSCLMKAIHDRSGLACEDDAEATNIITGCRSLTVDDEEFQLDIECPTEPEKPEVLPEAPHSCEAAFETKEYYSLWALEGNCFSKASMRDCEACTQSSDTIKGGL